MKVSEINDILKGTILCGEDRLDDIVSGGGSADLMEDVALADETRGEAALGVLVDVADAGRLDEIAAGDDGDREQVYATAISMDRLRDLSQQAVRDVRGNGCPVTELRYLETANVLTVTALRRELVQPKIAERSGRMTGNFSPFDARNEPADHGLITARTRSRPSQPTAPDTTSASSA